jgi:hypothetical protein
VDIKLKKAYFYAKAGLIVIPNSKSARKSHFLCKPRNDAGANEIEIAASDLSGSIRVTIAKVDDEMDSNCDPIGTFQVVLETPIVDQLKPILTCLGAGGNLYFKGKTISSEDTVLTT